MTELESVARVAGVGAVVAGDLDGTFLGAVGTSDGETIAAEMGFVGTTMLEIGDLLGLGPLTRLSLSGGARSSLLLVRQRSLITALVTPPQVLGQVERGVEAALQERT